MKAVIQRVSDASVTVGNKTVASINLGLVIFVGINYNDSENDMHKLCKKILGLRIFNDDNNKTNFSINQIKGEILLISQFTLCASTKKGNRPSFIKAMEPDKAKDLFNKLFNELIKSRLKIFKGKFGSMMDVKLNNIGPMTIILDTQNEK